MDAITSANRVSVNGDMYGSVQYVATVIGEATSGEAVPTVGLPTSLSLSIRKQMRQYGSIR